MSLVSDEHREVELSLSSVTARNDALVLVISMKPVARVAEWSQLPG